MANKNKMVVGYSIPNLRESEIRTLSYHPPTYSIENNSLPSYSLKANKRIY